MFGLNTLKTRSVPRPQANPFKPKGFPKRFSQQERQVRGSPIYTFRLKAIAADSKVVIPFDEQNTFLSSTIVDKTYQGMAKYMPFSDLTIHNISSEEINIKLNQDDTKIIPIPANTQRIVEAWEHGGIWSIEVINKHATNATSDYEVIISTWRRYPQEEELIYKKIARRFGVV